MSLTGKGTLSLRRKDVQEQKSIAVGFKKLAFAHKATLGDAGFNLSGLVMPTEMSSLGFTNPNVQELAAANLLFFRNNLKLVSSLKGVLQDYLSYNVVTSDRINFNGFTAEDGEIFTGVIDYSARNDVQMVDAAALTSTGTLAIGVTDYNVGTPFEVNKYPLTQIGSVLVFRNGLIQFRNPSNLTTGGNYQEVQAGAGLGTIIRFNNAPVSQDDNILVVSNGMLVYKPDGSVLAEVENLAGQMDKVVEVLADVSGQPENYFQTAPNNIDLKAFGDRVLELEADPDILAIESATFPIATAGYATGEAAQMSGNSVTLTSGLWLINGSVFHGGSGTETSTRKWAGIFDSNGDNATAISGKADLTVPTYGFNRLRSFFHGAAGVAENGPHVTLTPFYLRVTSSKTIYIVGAVDFTGAGGAQMTGYITAEKIRN